MNSDHQIIIKIYPDNSVGVNGFGYLKPEYQDLVIKELQKIRGLDA